MNTLQKPQEFRNEFRHNNNGRYYDSHRNTANRPQPQLQMPVSNENTQQIFHISELDSPGILSVGGFNPLSPQSRNLDDPQFDESMQRMKTKMDQLSSKYTQNKQNRLSTIKLTESNQNFSSQYQQIQPQIQPHIRNKYNNQGTGSFPTNAMNTDASFQSSQFQMTSESANRVKENYYGDGQLQSEKRNGPIAPYQSEQIIPQKGQATVYNLMQNDIQSLQSKIQEMEMKIQKKQVYESQQQPLRNRNVIPHQVHGSLPSSTSSPQTSPQRPRNIMQDTDQSLVMGMNKPLVFEGHKFTLNQESTDQRNKSNMFKKSENSIKNIPTTQGTPEMVEFKDSFNCTNLNLTKESNNFNIQRNINEDSYLLMDSVEKKLELKKQSSSNKVQKRQKSLNRSQLSRRSVKTSKTDNVMFNSRSKKKRPLTMTRQHSERKKTTYKICSKSQKGELQMFDGFSQSEYGSRKSVKSKKSRKRDNFSQRSMSVKNQKLHNQTNKELRREVERLNAKIKRQEDAVKKYKQLYISYQKVLNKLEKSEMTRREMKEQILTQQSKIFKLNKGKRGYQNKQAHQTRDSRLSNYQSYDKKNNASIQNTANNSNLKDKSQLKKQPSLNKMHKSQKSCSKLNLEKLHNEASTKLININNLHRGSKTKTQTEIDRIMNVRLTKEHKRQLSKLEKTGCESINLDLQAIKKQRVISHTANNTSTKPIFPLMQNGQFDYTMLPHDQQAHKDIMKQFIVDTQVHMGYISSQGSNSRSPLRSEQPIVPGILRSKSPAVLEGILRSKSPGMRRSTQESALSGNETSFDLAGYNQKKNFDLEGYNQRKKYY